MSEFSFLISILRFYIMLPCLRVSRCGFRKTCPMKILQLEFLIRVSINYYAPKLGNVEVRVQRVNGGM